MSTEDQAAEVAFTPRLLDQETVKRIVEGALFAANQPLKLERLAQLFEEHERPPTPMLIDVLQALKADYAGRGVQLKEVASGFRFQVEQEAGQWVSRLWDEKPARYSRALLETLALVAYRQPITRGEIEEIRGVSVSTHITRTLLERDWIRVVGHRDVPGRPAMYGTTRVFLDYFNLQNLDELPSLAEVRDLAAISAELDLALPVVENSEDDVAAADEVGTESKTDVEATAMAAESDVDKPPA